MKKRKQPEQTKPVNKTQSETPVKGKGTSRTIYFANQTAVDRLAVLLKKYPRANLSSMLNQLIVPLVAALEQATPEQRDIQLDVKFWL